MGMKLRGRGDMPTTIRLSISKIENEIGDGFVFSVKTQDGRTISEINTRPMNQSQFPLPGPRSVKKLDRATLVSILAYIEASLANDVQIGALAKIAGASSHHFCRRFKATTGSSPYAFATAIRMIWAKWLLAETSLSTEEISERVGIANVGYFRKQFRKKFGINPSTSREKGEVDVSFSKNTKNQIGETHELTCSFPLR
jgi:transcriptional regulator GlxA family with amidase domain